MRNKSCDAIIFCAGEGRRLKDIASDIPKPLLKITQNKRIIDYTIEYLINSHFDRVYISYSRGEDYFNGLKEQYKKEIEIILLFESAILGQGGTLLSNKSKFTDRDYLIGINGDTIFDIKYEFISELLSKSYDISILSNNKLELPKNLLADENDMLVGVVGTSKIYFYTKTKMLSQNTTRYNNLGLLIIQTKIFEDLEYDGGFLGIYGENDLMEMVIKTGGDIHIHEMTACKKYFTINTPEEYFNAQKIEGNRND